MGSAGEVADLTKQLRAKGYRLTPARQLVLSAVSGLEHATPDAICAEVQRTASSVNLSTVYRTIKLFEANGFLERHDFGAGRGRYEETARRHHDHLIDLDSGKVIEFRNEEIERLQERVARELGFNLVGHKLELYGVPTPAKRARK